MIPLRREVVDISELGIIGCWLGIKNSDLFNSSKEPACRRQLTAIIGSRIFSSIFSDFYGFSLS